MKLSEIVIGTKLELELFNSMGEKIRPPLISELEWAENDNSAYIATPIHEGVLYPVRIGTVMTVCFFAKDNVYRFKAKVSNRCLKDNIYLLKIEALSVLEKVQRRQFYRFDWSIPVKYRVIESVEPESEVENPYKDGITRDISGGGLSIALKEKVEMEKLVECLLPLRSDFTVKFIGKVVRSVKRNLEASKYDYEIGVSFKKIDNKDREAVIKYIFEEQRKLRKKGLI